MATTTRKPRAPRTPRKPNLAKVCFPTPVYIVTGWDHAAQTATEHVMAWEELDAWMRGCVAQGYQGTFRAVYAHGYDRTECDVAPVWNTPAQAQAPQSGTAHEWNRMKGAFNASPLRYVVDYFTK